MQLVSGPRQVGKTTLVKQALAQTGIPHAHADTDLPAPQDRDWIIHQWDAARGRLAREPSRDFVLVLDEVQKISQWSGVVKWLWDQDAWHHVPLKVVLIGSAPMFMDKGLTESLAGRFETLHLPHWGFHEMRDAFGWDWERYVFFGGYPGAARLTDDEDRWRRYVLDTVVETAIARDVLLHARVTKPLPLRQLLRLGCEHSPGIVSHNRMLKRLEDVGNATTLGHYLELLEGVGLLAGLQKHHPDPCRIRKSIPKLQVFNTAPMSALSGLSFADARKDHEFWDRLVGSAVGAHLVNAQACHDCTVRYWRENNEGVDFVVGADGELLAIEVTTGPVPPNLRGISAFRKRHPDAGGLAVGNHATSVEDFLARPVSEWVNLRTSFRFPPPGDGV